MADIDVERTTMLWPAELKRRVQGRVGARGLTAFTVAAVEQRLAQLDTQDATNPNPPQAPAELEVSGRVDLGDDPDGDLDGYDGAITALPTAGADIQPVQEPHGEIGRPSEPQAHSAQITAKILAGNGTTPRVANLKERFGLTAASDLPTGPCVNCGQATTSRIRRDDDVEVFEHRTCPESEPVAPTAVSDEPREEEPPAPGICPDCLAPLIDNVCWACSM